jgi:membrane protein YdbS with pleckstrin-like domain
MGLPVSQLGPNEHIVIETREHWKHLLGAGLICLLAIVGVVVVQVIAPAEGFWAWLGAAGWIAFVLVVLIFGVWPWLRWLNRTSTLTDERLVTRSGIVRRTGRDIPLDRINDTAYDQGIVDRMVKCGTLKVSAASEQGTVVLRDIPMVHEFVRTMNVLVKEARSDNGGT